MPLGESSFGLFLFFGFDFALCLFVSFLFFFCLFVCCFFFGGGYFLLVFGLPVADFFKIDTRFQFVPRIIITYH